MILLRDFNVNFLEKGKHRRWRDVVSSFSLNLWGSEISRTFIDHVYANNPLHYVTLQKVV